MLVCCGVLWCVVVCCTVLWRVVLCCGVLCCVVVYYDLWSVLQCFICETAQHLVNHGATLLCRMAQ